MKLSLFRLIAAVFVLAALQALTFAQVSGSISGAVTDSNGAIVPGAMVEVKGDRGQNFSTTTNENGLYRIPSVPEGTYTVTVSAANFKKSVVNNLKVDVGLPATANIALEAGDINEVVEVSSGAEVLQTETATVGTTLTGRQITDIPTASRDALDLVLAMPGTATPGRPRTSTVNGLPKGALNITIDGINVQDNLLRSSDGFFTYIRPRTDAVGEVTVSTSNPGAESSGEGAVQIKFVTQSGKNDFSGGLYWYHRNPALNTNYWFNNRDLPADPVTGKAPQQRILLNQFGGKLGGPISIPRLFSGKDKAFFFVNYEEYRLPERSPLRTRTIMSPEAQSGIYRFTAAANYTPPAGSTITCAPSGSGQLCSFNVLNRATALGIAGLPGTADSTITGLLSDIRSSVSNYTIVPTGNPNLQQVSFFNNGNQVRKFPTVRLDFNPWKNHHFENIWNYQDFKSSVDFLNGADSAFPDFPNFGSQDSIRFSNASAWRWNIRDNVVNEARFGLMGGTSLFFAQVSPGQFANQGGLALAISAAGVSNGYTLTNFERRNSPVQQFTNNLTWSTGNHAFTFGGNFTQVNLWREGGNPVVPVVGFGLSSTLEAANFAALVGQLPSGNQGAAAALYATLTGRMSSIGANAYQSEESNKFTYNGKYTQRAIQREYGFFGQDTWKVAPNLTLTLGLRWEIQGPFIPKNSVFSIASYESLWGESGVGNIFMPGTLTGSPTVYTKLDEGTKIWETDYNNVAPSVGIAWTPNWGKGIFKPIFGEAGQTVIRGGYSRAFVREGTNTFLSIIGSNPGLSIGASQNISGTPYPMTPGLLLRNGLPAEPNIPSSLTFPYVGTTSDSVNVFHPELETGYVDSYTVGVQRELTSNMAVEFRYVSNRGNDLWRQYNLNELNVIENGFLEEFKLAQQNYLANRLCASTPGCTGGGSHFRYRGPNTGTSPLPIIMAYFTGLAPTAANAAATANYTSSLFANTTFTSTLNPLAPSPTGFAATIGGTANASLFEPTRIAAGIPSNFFYLNPGKRGGGAWIIDNSAKTWYDAFQFEFRRRLTQGLLVQANYTFSKSLANTYASSSVAADQPATVREGKDMRRGLSPFDVTHAFKTNFIWEIPAGRGKWLAGDAPGWLNHIVGGWGLNGNIRWQSGTPFSLGNVQLVGMTVDELQDMVGIYKNDRDAAGTASRDVYFLPFEVRQNTYRAFNVGLVSGAPTFTQGAPTGKFIAPANYDNCMQAYSGQCGFQNLVLKGPSFFRADISVVKKFQITERVNFEMRGEFLNAFNNINFIAGAAANDVNSIGGQGATTFARYTAAYQDVSTTNDPGGRLTQIVLRLNF